MKAALYYEYGGPEVVKIGTAPKPMPKEDEVLIRVHASTVNRTDCGFRSAEYTIVRLFGGLFRPKLNILGCDFAGEIAAVGSAVSSYAPGDRVVGFEEWKFGAHAEYIIQKANQPFTRIPDGMTYEQAAPILEGAHYALNNLRAAGIAPGQRWLINGGTGAIGSAAVQLAKYFGAHVTAVCAGSHRELVRSLGADDVIDYQSEDFTRRPQRFDVVFDAVGARTFGECKPVLTPKGIYMSTELGPGSQNPFLALITPFTGGRKVLFPIPTLTVEDVEFIVRLVTEGKFRPLVDRTYPLDRIVEAYAYVETRMKIGNVVLTIP
ncbi:MAG: NAD(P)-dependent alcohol dehydrogenase [Bacteroidetes bacterium]|nr:NAD(P)-dependent alcohol dehydrogenase [Bacteroidota bacterium]